MSAKELAEGIKFINVNFPAPIIKSTGEGITFMPAASKTNCALGIWKAEVTKITLGLSGERSFLIALASWSVFSTFSVIRISFLGIPSFIASFFKNSPSGTPMDQGSFPPVNIKTGALFDLNKAIPAKNLSTPPPHS